ncbi:hypothetical protein E2C01_010614 [Portunus trituberculatus]|uniref:Uncharacterized protein n=1 Tax=Portunus trituberculatus TaxID=210409 RepID=A0A5B7D8V0_PORTR|nr:hypothetical protein [Portunus trituberculatus]
MAPRIRYGSTWVRLGVDKALPPFLPLSLFPHPVTPPLQPSPLHSNPVALPAPVTFPTLSPLCSCLPFRHPVTCHSPHSPYSLTRPCHALGHCYSRQVVDFRGLICNVEEEEEVVVIVEEEVEEEEAKEESKRNHCH